MIRVSTPRRTKALVTMLDEYNLHRFADAPITLYLYGSETAVHAHDTCKRPRPDRTVEMTLRTVAELKAGDRDCWCMADEFVLQQLRQTKTVDSYAVSVAWQLVQHIEKAHSKSPVAAIRARAVLGTYQKQLATCGAAAGVGPDVAAAVERIAETVRETLGEQGDQAKVRGEFEQMMFSAKLNSGQDQNLVLVGVVGRLYNARLKAAVEAWKIADSDTCHVLAAPLWAVPWLVRHSATVSSTVQLASYPGREIAKIAAGIWDPSTRPTAKTGRRKTAAYTFPESSVATLDGAVEAAHLLAEAVAA